MTSLKKSSAFLLILLLPSCAKMPVNNSVAQLRDENWSIECQHGSIYYGDGDIVISLAPKKRRCEVANTKWIKQGRKFEFKFTVATTDVNTFDSEWHSVMQFHAFPDKNMGEKWRCPVLALEVKNGNFRMYNRWDEQKKSKLVKGTCADVANSIQSRLVFENYAIKANTAYKVKVLGVLSHQNDGYLSVFINGVRVGKVKGPTTFNDIRDPYIKLGIYKPSYWQYSQELKYSFSSISFQNII